MHSVGKHSALQNHPESAERPHTTPSITSVDDARTTATTRCVCTSLCAEAHTHSKVVRGTCLTSCIEAAVSSSPRLNRRERANDDEGDEEPEYVRPRRL